jgi:hypothetical protein
MKTTNLICNACRKTVVIDREEVYGPYPVAASVEGWFKIMVGELRKAPPRKTMTDFMHEMVNVAEIPEEKREAAVRMVSTFAQAEHDSAYPFAHALPISRSADICPDCAPKALGGILPHLVGEEPHGLVGTVISSPRFPTPPDDENA